ncbi:MAG: branched-chain amino acid ABC transporter permease [Chloroflexi bacterium]|nr:branched-chain amino acid ABC transporter permease [Chloroflexota bacterium]
MLSSPEILQTRSATPWLKSAAQIGVIGGIITISIALQGMIQAFSSRDVIYQVVTMSQAAILLTFFVMGYVAAMRLPMRAASSSIGAGAVAGFISSAALVLLIGLGNVVNLGNVFVNATPQLYELLTFKLGLPIGSLALLLAGLGLGALAGAILLLPDSPRRAILTTLAWIVGLGVLQDLIRVTFADWGFLESALRFFYASNGLSLVGALVLSVLIPALAILWDKQAPRAQTRIDRLPAPTQRALRWGSLGFGVVILFLLPALLGLYLSEVLDNVGLYLLMGLGLNIVVGFAGLLDLGYVAFFAIGAYVAGVLTSPEFSTGVIPNWWLALPIAVLASGAFGVLLGIPVLKMRGDYLAIVTLGFGEIIRLLALSDFLKPWIGGAQGIQRIAKPDLPFIQISWGPQAFYYLFLAGCLLVIFVSYRLKSSRLGRAWMAVREDEDVAQAMGINLVATKLKAFGMGALFGGLAGAIFATKLESIYPHSFNFLISINVLCLIIIGGMGSIPGVVVGALALVGLPELLREFAEFRFLFYGIALVVMMLTRPEGLIPEARRAMELEEFREEETEQATAS